MIDYLIFYPKKKIGLMWSFTLKVMNFFIFRDFSRFFSKFIVDLFRILNFLKIVFIRWVDVTKHRHVVSCVHVT